MFLRISWLRPPPISRRSKRSPVTFSTLANRSSGSGVDTRLVEQNLLALKLAGGLSSAEIGEVVGKSAGAVRVELHRIIQQLRVRHERQMEG